MAGESAEGGEGEETIAKQDRLRGASDDVEFSDENVLVAAPTKTNLSGLHPFIQGLLDTLPAPDTNLTVEGRAKWLQAAANIFDLIYKDSGEIRSRAYATTTGSRNYWCGWSKSPPSAGSACWPAKDAARWENRKSARARPN